MGWLLFALSLLTISAVDGYLTRRRRARLLGLPDGEAPAQREGAGP